MSFPRSASKTAEVAVEQKVMELNALCHVAFMNYADQLAPADLTKKADIKANKKTQDDANDVIDSLLRKKILLVEPDLKKLPEIRNALKIIIDKKLTNKPITDTEQASLDKYVIGQASLDEIAEQKNKLDKATDALFKLQVKPPTPSRESAAARQTLSSYISFDILSAQSDQEKAKKIDHWAQVMKGMLSSGNYYGAYVVLNTLRDDKVKSSTAMEQVARQTRSTLTRAEKIFASKKSLYEDMEKCAKSGKSVIPSTHIDEGALVGASEKIDFVTWNGIVGRLSAQAQVLRAQPDPVLTGPLATTLLVGRISSSVNLAQEKQSKTEASMISVIETQRKQTLKAEGFNDFMSLKSNIQSKLEAMQKYVDQKAKDQRPEIIERRGLLIDLIAVVKKGINTFSDLSNPVKQQEIIKAIDDALQNKAISAHISNKSGDAETRTHQMIRELGDLFGQLNRKTALIEVSTQPLNVKKEMEELLAPETKKLLDEKPIYIGPKYVANLNQMLKILNRMDDSAVRDKAVKLKQAFDLMGQQRLLRKQETLFDPLVNVKEEMIPYMQKQQDKKEMLQDKLEEEIRAAKVVHQVINELRNKNPDSKEVAQLVAGFNHHLGKMALDALDHPNPDLTQDIQQLRISRVIKVKVEVSNVVSSTPQAKEARTINNDNIQLLEQQRDAVIARHQAAVFAAARSEKGKEEIPPLNTADQQQVNDIGNQLHLLHEANRTMIIAKNINRVPPKPVTSSGLESEQQEVASPKKSTMMRVMGRMRGLFDKDKLAASIKSKASHKPKAVEQPKEDTALKLKK